MDGRLNPDHRSVQPLLVRPLKADTALTYALDDGAGRVARELVTEGVLLDRAAGVELPAAPGLVLLLLDGLLVCRTTVAGETSVELLGAGDVVAGAPRGSDESIVGLATWQVLEPTHLALLDARFARAIARWPPVTAELLLRATRRAEAMAFLRSLTRVRHLEVRLLLLLWHLADRWGYVAPDGVVLPLALTQQLLAELVCARRPSVNLALRTLASDGAISARAAGGWLLHGPPPASGAGSAAGKHAATGRAPEHAGTVRAVSGLTRGSDVVSAA